MECELYFNKVIWLKIETRGFPGGPVVKNPPCNVGDMGLIPGLGTKIAHAVEQLSPRATKRELVCHSRRSCMPKQGPKEGK